LSLFIFLDRPLPCFAIHHFHHDERADAECDQQKKTPHRAHDFQSPSRDTSAECQVMMSVLRLGILADAPARGK